MKSKKFFRKLTLNKRTIVNLNPSELNVVFGGNDSRDTCWTWCCTDQCGTTDCTIACTTWKVCDTCPLPVTK